jgi:probable HAF family extracellular repeat protein
MMRFLSFLFLAAGIVALPCIASAATLQVTDLGPAVNFIGVPLQSPVINDQGQVAGVIDSSGTPLPFIWKDGVRTDLPNLPGATRVSVTGINSSGQVVGYSDAADGNTYAVTWQGGVISKLNSEQGNVAFAFGINDSGLIVGAIAERPVLWDGDSVTDLGAPNGTAALGINNSGVISGGRPLGGPIAPVGFLWQNGTLTDLGPQGVCVGTAINDEGVTAGIIQFPIGGKISYHAMTYQNGVVSDLGAIPGGIASIATGINDLGQVIGVGDMNGASPFIWQAGQMTELQSLLPQDSPWLLFGGVSDINNHGQIVGIALNRSNSYQRELVMLTIPEPSSLLLLLIGLTGLSLRGRRQA